MKLKIFILALTFSLFQTAFGQETAVTDQNQQQGYLIGPGDVITGKVMTDSEFDFTSTVDEDGKIQVSFSEERILAKCRTEKEVTADVKQLLSKYLKNPQISVRVTERRAPMVIVSGEVEKPGPIELKRRNTRLLDIVTFSGGPTEDASGMIQVFRTQTPLCEYKDENEIWAGKTVDEVPHRMYSLRSVMQGSTEANPIILPGDVIVLQKASPVYITGEVRQPTGVYIKEDGLSLIQAIGMIGGVNREAEKKNIRIYRLQPGSKERNVITVNYALIKKGEQKDVMLEPYDIVEVDKEKPSVLQSIMKIALGTGQTIISSGASSLTYRVLY